MGKGDLVVASSVWSVGRAVGVTRAVTAESSHASQWSNAGSRDLASVVGVHARRETSVLSGATTAAVVAVGNEWSLWAQGASAANWT